MAWHEVEKNTYRCDVCGTTVKLSSPLQPDGDIVHDCERLKEYRELNQAKKKRQANLIPPHPAGPGTHLHRLIERLTGEHPMAGCGCENFILQMDALGPAGCREPANLERFTERIHEQAKARRWKLLRIPGTQWIGKELAHVPGAKTICRRIVLAAIRRAEREAREWREKAR